MADVFISYARRNGDLASTLRSELDARGISVWWDGDIVPGVAWDQSIRQHLEAAKVVVVLWTPDAIPSKFVRDEAGFAVDTDRYVGVTNGAQPPLEFRRHHHLQMGKWDTFLPGLLRELANRGVAIGKASSALPSNATAGPEAPKRNRGYAFISHVEEDGEPVAEVSGFLKGRGYAYWSYHDSDRDYQKPTVLEIEQRMVDSTLVLSVITPEWKFSEWTLRELAFARELRKPLFLLRFRNPGPTLALAGDTYIDFERDRPGGFRRLGVELDKKGL